MPRPLHLRPSDYRVMPWKNGLGTTTEIAVDPPGARIDDFTWRISVADLGASGPFSSFPGLDRLLVQIEGAPMTLAHEGRGEHRLRLFHPHRFAGELSTYGTLEAPPARDFNVMVRRDRASADLLVHELGLGAEAPVGSAGSAATRLVYVVRGAAAAEVDGEHAALGAADTLVVEGAGALSLTAGPAGAVVIVVAVGPAATSTPAG
jgi:environmental stress-induced protein Ves